MSGNSKVDRNKTRWQRIAQEQQTPLACFRNWPVKKGAAEASTNSSIVRETRLVGNQLYRITWPEKVGCSHRIRNVSAFCRCWYRLQHLGSLPGMAGVAQEAVQATTLWARCKNWKRTPEPVEGGCHQRKTRVPFPFALKVLEADKARWRGGSGTLTLQVRGSNPRGPTTTKAAAHAAAFVCLDSVFGCVS